MKKKLLSVVVAFSIIFTSHISAQMTQEEFEKLVDSDFSKCFYGKQMTLNAEINHNYIEETLGIERVNSLNEIKWDKDNKIHYFLISGKLIEYYYKNGTVNFEIINPNNCIDENDDNTTFPKYAFLINNTAKTESITLQAPKLFTLTEYTYPFTYYLSNEKCTNMLADFYIAAGTWIADNGKEYSYVKVAYINICGYPSLNPKNCLVTAGYKIIDFNDYWEQLSNAFSNKIINPYNFIYVDPYDLMLLVELYSDKLKSVSFSNWDSDTQLWYSNVVFVSQTNMDIYVKSEDGTFSQTMNFAGRTSSLKNGDKIRIYYSVEKKRYSTDWTVYAIEKLQ